MSVVGAKVSMMTARIAVSGRRTQRRTQNPETCLRDGPGAAFQRRAKRVVALAILMMAFRATR
jgi:hypothetical protein